MFVHEYVLIHEEVGGVDSGFDEGVEVGVLELGLHDAGGVYGRVVSSEEYVDAFACFACGFVVWFECFGEVATFDEAVGCG